MVVPAAAAAPRIADAEELAPLQLFRQYTQSKGLVSEVHLILTDCELNTCTRWLQEGQLHLDVSRWPLQLFRHDAEFKRLSLEMRPVCNYLSAKASTFNSVCKSSCVSMRNVRDAVAAVNLWHCCITSFAHAHVHNRSRGCHLCCELLNGPHNCSGRKRTMWPIDVLMATAQTAAVGEAILRDLPGGLAASPRAATDVEFSEVELCGYGPFRWGLITVST